MLIPKKNRKDVYKYLFTGAPAVCHGPNTDSLFSLQWGVHIQSLHDTTIIEKTALVGDGTRSFHEGHAD